MGQAVTLKVPAAAGRRSDVNVKA